MAKVRVTVSVDIDLNPGDYKDEGSDRMPSVEECAAMVKKNLEDGDYAFEEIIPDYAKRIITITPL